MKKLIAVAILVSASCSALAQGLTPSQKDADFRYLAGLYSTYYAPLDWKKQLFGFDALNIQPWLDRVAKTTTDLDFYELYVEYVSSLNDTHDAFSLPSDFVASLPAPSAQRSSERILPPLAQAHLHALAALCARKSQKSRKSPPATSSILRAAAPINPFSASKPTPCRPGRNLARR